MGRISSIYLTHVGRFCFVVHRSLAVIFYVSFRAEKEALDLATLQEELGFERSTEMPQVKPAFEDNTDKDDELV